MPIAEGQKAPAFALPDQDGKTVRLSDFKGKKVVLYFYPKDDTPGCTTEACDFRDRLRDFTSQDVAVLGVSPDSPKSHQKFIGKFGLTFPLLSDEEKTILNAYGVWKEKSMYGRKYMGVERTTIIIGKDGVIQKIFPKVSVTGHATAVLDALTA